MGGRDLQDNDSESASSEYSNHEGEEATVPTAIPKSKTVSSVIKYKTRLKCNGVVSH